MRYRLGERSARLSYLLPAGRLVDHAPDSLLEGLAFQAGEWGAFHLLAEIEEHAPAFETLRRTGFAVVTWQRVWQIDTALETNPTVSSFWQGASPLDDISIRNLYQSLVPPLVQSAEALSTAHLQGMIYYQGDEIFGYVDIAQGPRGVYLLPLIHPTVDNVMDLLRDLIRRLSPRQGRPIYLAVRSYQSWLEGTLEELGAQPGQRQALLVKHLAAVQRVLATNRRVVIEGAKAEPTAPITNS